MLYAVHIKVYIIVTFVALIWGSFTLYIFFAREIPVVILLTQILIGILSS